MQTPEYILLHGRATLPAYRHRPDCCGGLQAPIGTAFAGQSAMTKSRKKDNRHQSHANTQRTGDSTPATADRERVAARAYERYLARGAADGAAVDDWLEAERELASGDTGPKPE
jgi:hypothetical protein